MFLKVVLSFFQFEFAFLKMEFIDKLCSMFILILLQLSFILFSRVGVK